MCSIETVRSSSFSTYNEKVSLRIIDKRLKHLRKELRSLTKRKIPYATNNLLTEQQTNESQMQYNKRLNQLLRLHDKQVNNLNLWHLYQSNRIEQMYVHELRQSNENFQTKKIDFKSKLLSTLNDKRRYFDFEHQNINIRCRYLPNKDQINNSIHDNLLTETQNQHSNELSQQRPTYNLRRAPANDLITENSSSTTSLQDLSIFSRSNSQLPPFGGIELQRSLSNTDIEQDIKAVQNSLRYTRSMIDKESKQTSFDDHTERSQMDVWIEDGRLWYQRAWFSRNSPILLVFNDLETVPALILNVGRNDLLIRRLGTNIKHRISLSLLYDGHVAIRKRN